MAASSLWDTIHAERAALADQLAGVGDSAWSTPSLCARWNCQQMLGHMIATAKMTPPRFFGHFIGSGFRFDVMAAKDAARESSGSPQQTLAEFRAHLNDSTSPPGPADTWLGETVVHGTDIRWPLGLSHDFPAQTLVRVADSYKGSNTLIGAKRRIAGVTLRAGDADWSHGSGPEVSGPMLALVMAMTGRRAALDHLSGPGKDTLASQM